MKYFSQGMGMGGSVIGVSRVLLAGGLLAVVAGVGWAIRITTEGNRTADADYRQPDVSSTHTFNRPTSAAVPAGPSPSAGSPGVAAPGISDRGEPGLQDTQQSGTQQGGKFPVTIRKPAGPPRIELGAYGTLGNYDAAGKPVTVACSTCHATRPANFAIRESADLDEFHQNLAYAHGKVSCLSCHNPRNYDTLHLADGTSVEYSEVMTLCGQCHGPKTRDYRHGAHGGMTGYWDLSRGPRTRNNCVDCHAPHAPSFPAMVPTFKPRDRFLSGPRDVEKGHPGGSNHE